MSIPVGEVGGVFVRLPLFVAQSQVPVEIAVGARALQQALVLQPLEVGELAQAAGAEFPCRDIGERRAALGRAQRAIDENETLQPADDVAADFSAGEPRELRPDRGLQISDGGQRQQVGGRQFGRTAVAQHARARRADRAGEMRLRAKLRAASDGDDVVGTPAQFVDDVCVKIVEIAPLPDQPRERLAGYRIARGKNWRLDAAYSFAPAHGLGQVGEIPVERHIGAGLPRSAYRRFSTARRVNASATGLGEAAR
nr:hypothetical protein [Methylosinus sp. RM1]